VVTPFLPGDSLLFAAGAAIATTGALSPVLMILILAAAAVLGNMVNYAAGHFIGPKVFTKPKSLFFNPEHLNRAHQFYEKYGGKAIVIARFAPILRTFAPFVAGVGRMSYGRFIAYNVIGSAGWVMIMFLAGYWFANVEFVKKHFSTVILAIIVISLIPAAVEAFRAWRAKRQVQNEK
jgi:membrane-associated protein